MLSRRYTYPARDPAASVLPLSVGLNISPATKTHDTAGSAAEWRHQRMPLGLACLLLYLGWYLGALTSGAHPNTEGDAMNTRHTSYALIAAVVSALMLAPWHGAAWPQETDIE